MPADLPVPGARDAAYLAADQALQAYHQAQAFRAQVRAHLDAANATLNAQVLSGLKINGVADTQLNAGPAKVTLSPQEIAMTLGAAFMKIGPAGLSGDGMLIKLG